MRLTSGRLQRYNLAMSKGAPGVRYAEVERDTDATRVQVVLDLDGGTRRDITTGIAVFDQMLKLFAQHGALDLGITVEADADVDDTPIVSEVGAAVGMALRIALADSGSSTRSTSFSEPVGDALVLMAVDLGGRGQMVFNVEFSREKIGTLSTQNLKEFLRAFASESGATLHVHKFFGENDHSVAESIFKGLGRCLREASASA